MASSSLHNPRMHRKCIEVLSCLVLSSATAGAQEEVSFTQVQVDAGQALYRESCQLCHGSTLSNGQFGSPLKGSFFQRTWKGRTLGELLQYTREEMPPDEPGKYSPEQNAELIAFILSRNKLAPGDLPLTSDPARSNTLLLPW